MRLAKLLVAALAGTVVCACGGSSSDGLFDGTNPSSAAGASAFGGATGFAGGGSSSGGASEMANTGGGSSGGSTGAGGGFGGANTGGAGFGGDLGAGGEIGIGGFGQGGGGGASTGGTTGVGDGGAGGAGGALNTGCPAGDYSAKLKGPYTSSTGTKDIGASITFTVDGAGAVTGSFMGPGGAKAKLVGQVDCSTGQLKVNVQNGTYPIGPLMVSFSGTLAGRYDEATQTFVDGTWDLTERNTAGNGGTGTWAPQ